MRVINIHQRVYNQKSIVISEILDSLSSKNDRLWPNELWPPMKLSEGLKLNSHGGHGSIGYYVSSYDPGKSIEFTFTNPTDYVGTHSFEIIQLSDYTSRLQHKIDMNLNFKGSITWYLAIKWLHDALLEDCLDKVHNQLNENQVHTPHNFWVKKLRNMIKRKKMFQVRIACN